ncbi:MAG: hypothetical protein HDR01_02650 [Lachnospiraceae bacterium]|nr:hypothetical protein [Lachnospiraceae bacterium]
MDRSDKILYCIAVIPSVLIIVLGTALGIDIKIEWVIAYCIFLVVVVKFLKIIIQMKKERPDMGMGEQIRLRKELRRKNEALLKQTEPEELSACILARRELVEQAVGFDRIVYTINLAERLYANGELDEAANMLDSIASEVEGSRAEFIYWYNRIAIEMCRQKEEEAKKMIPRVLESMEGIKGGKKKQKLLDIFFMRISVWQAVLEKRYEEALLLLAKIEKILDEETMYKKQYRLMEKLNIYLKLNNVQKALEVEKELKQEKRVPLIDWWLKQHGM